VGIVNEEGNGYIVPVTDQIKTRNGCTILVTCPPKNWNGSVVPVNCRPKELRWLLCSRYLPSKEIETVP
jgi:hypothetical protein